MSNKWIITACMTFLACGHQGDRMAGALPDGEATVLAVAGDFKQTGIVSAVSLPSLAVAQNILDGVASGDPTIRKYGDRVFIINRTENNVVILDGSTRAFIDQIATGEKSNPQDVAVRGDLVYVAALGSPGVLVFDLRDVHASPRLIDLSALDSDGLPNCGSLAISGSQLVVACEILDGTSKPRGKGKVAILDLDRPDMNREVTVLELSERNPFGWFEFLGSDNELAIATVPNLITADLKSGCLERVLIRERRTECFIPNDRLGGFAGSYKMLPSGELMVAVTTGFDAVDFGPHGHVMTWSKERDFAVMKDLGDRLFDMAVCRSGHLVLAEARAGLRIYDSSGRELSSAPIQIGMPPVQNGMVCL